MDLLRRCWSSLGGEGEGEGEGCVIQLLSDNVGAVERGLVDGGRVVVVVVVVPEEYIDEDFVGERCSSDGVVFGGCIWFRSWS